MCSIHKAISDELKDDDCQAFTTTPCLSTACRQYFSNFELMWAPQTHRQDLRVAATLLLRMNLAKKRFFREHKRHISKDLAESRSKTRASSFGRMNTLFKLLLQVQDNHKKVFVVAKFVKRMFGSSTHPSCGKPVEEDVTGMLKLT